MCQKPVRHWLNLGGDLSKLFRAARVGSKTNESGVVGTLQSYHPGPEAITMHEELWAGVELKINNAEIFFEGMGKALLPPNQTPMSIAVQSAGAITDTLWQQSFYADLDAFLAMARSVPEILQWGFGIDKLFSSKWEPWKSWFDRIDPTEKTRRQNFATKFKPAHDAFREIALSTARNISLHRIGIAPVEVNITGRFGVSYIGTPVRRVPTAESATIVAGDNPSLQWAATQPPVSIRPAWTDFKIDGKPLFHECQDYLAKAGSLLAEARHISQKIHGNNKLTTPPLS